MKITRAGQEVGWTGENGYDGIVAETLVPGQKRGLTLTSEVDGGVVEAVLFHGGTEAIELSEPEHYRAAEGPGWHSTPSWLDRRERRPLCEVRITLQARGGRGEGGRVEFDAKVVFDGSPGRWNIEVADPSAGLELIDLSPRRRGIGAYVYLRWMGFTLNMGGAFDHESSGEGTLIPMGAEGGGRIECKLAGGGNVRGSIKLAEAGSGRFLSFRALEESIMRSAETGQLVSWRVRIDLPGYRLVVGTAGTGSNASRPSVVPGSATEVPLEAAAGTIRTPDAGATGMSQGGGGNNAKSPAPPASPAPPPPYPMMPGSSKGRGFPGLGWAGKFLSLVMPEKAAPPTKPAPPSAGELLRHMEAQPAGEAKPPQVGGAVDCTVFAPDRVERKNSGLLQVFIHSPTDRAQAAAEARQFDPGTVERGHRSLVLDAQPGTVFAFEAEVEGMVIAECRDQLIWNGEPQAAAFHFTVPGGCKWGQQAGTVRVSKDGMPVGRIAFQIEVVRDATGASHRPAGTEARRYRRCFCSYAWQDRPEMLKRAQGLRATGLETFIDVMDLRPGEVWNPKIFGAIDECDLFVVMWSQHAQRSKWVRKEAQYALKSSKGRRGLDFRPIPVEGPPIAAVPRSLSAFHFNDELLSLIRAAELEMSQRTGSQRGP